MLIRKATEKDGMVISNLLSQLDYPDTDDFIKERIRQMQNSPDAELLVYEMDDQVVACISMHFIPQIALEGDFARISYFVVDSHYRGHGIGHEMLEFCTNLARERKCDRMEVHSNARRTGAHKFYFRERFEESPKYFIKMLR
jgi:N-acetylglutamate synthase-like GNAT family acetyltransferase